MMSRVLKIEQSGGKMKAVKCDRCKKYFDNEIKLIRYKHHKTDNEEYQIDICPECFDKFVKFMKEEQE